MSRTLTGLSLILIGSGLYWILSSQLISSFTVLVPNTFGPASLGTTLILTVGILSSGIGLATVSNDLDELSRLFTRNDGWLFTLPIIFATLDVQLSVLGLETGRVIELNPFIASTVATGTMALASFFISYLALSEGLALLMLTLGRTLFGTNTSTKFLAFAATCGAASFGPFTNILILMTSPVSGLYLFGAVCSMLLSARIFFHFKKIESPKIDRPPF